MGGFSDEALPLVFLDLETTGLNPGLQRWHDRVCEIAALRFTESGECDRLVTLVDPQRPIPASATAIHQITDEMIRDAPTFLHVIPELCRVVEGATLVIHNAPFDLGFLRAEFQRNGVPWQECPVVDTLLLARRLLPTSRHNLPGLARALGIQPGGHRALGDVLTMKAVYEHLRNQEDYRARRSVSWRPSSYRSR